MPHSRTLERRRSGPSDLFAQNVTLLSHIFTHRACSTSISTFLRIAFGTTFRRRPIKNDSTFIRLFIERPRCWIRHAFRTPCSWPTRFPPTLRRVEYHPYRIRYTVLRNTTGAYEDKPHQYPRDAERAATGQCVTQPAASMPGRNAPTFSSGAPARLRPLDCLMPAAPRYC